MSGKVAIGFKAFFIAFFIIACLGGMFALVIAQEVPTGSVTGVVVHRDKEVFKGYVASARITLSSGGVLKRAITDKDGRYRINDIPAGEHWITASAPDLIYWNDTQVVVKEGRTSKAKPIVMATRPPDINAYLMRTTFSPDEKAKININGYSRIDKTAHVTIFKLDVKSYMIQKSRSLNQQPSTWSYTDPKPQKEWDEKLHKKNDNTFSGYFSLPTDKIGGFTVRITMGNITRDYWYMVSNLGLIVKKSKNQVLTYCTNFKTRKPVEGVVITEYIDGAVKWTGTSDKDGLLIISDSTAQVTPSIIAENDGSFASTDINYYHDETDRVCYMYTDRPVYRPGQKVYFKGILRLRWNNFYKPIPDENVPIQVKDATGKKLFSLNVKTNDVGTFNGNFTLPEKTSLGSYEISASIQEDDFSTRDHNINIQVAEYRKPEYTVGLSFDKEFFISGTPIQATVQASYYFGAPVSDADVTYTVFKSPVYYYEYEYGDEFYDEFERQYNGGEYGYGEYVMDGKGTTDSDGKLHISIPTEKGAPDDCTYQVEVNVTDQSLRSIGASGSVLVPKGLFRLSANTKEAIVKPGDPVNIGIKAIDYDKRPVTNTNVSIRIDEQIWTEHNVKYKMVSYGGRTTNTAGKANFTYKPAKEGNYRIRLESKDRLGNIIRGTGYVWVAGDDYSGYGYKGPSLEIVRDKKVYKVGDEARIIINSSVKDVYALLTVEGKRIYHHRLVHLKGNSTLVKLNAREEYVPNAFISVCLVDGMAFVNTETPFNVSPSYKFLKVEIKSDKDVYKPGDTARYRVKTTDLKGRPVSAEVSLGIVDESIYAIMEDRTPEIRNFFYGPRGNQVSTSYSFPDYYMGGADKDGSEGKVRKNFPDTAYWSPDIRTNSAGEATISMPVPDSLTTWRATARAITGDTQVGWAVQKVKATKDLIVRLQAPRFLTQNDQLSIGAALHNYTDRSQRVQLKLEVKGLDLRGELIKTVTINKGQVLRFEWPVTAAKVGNAHLTVYAKGETDSDATEVNLPVFPHGLDRIRTTNGAVDRESTIRINVPNSAIPETVNLELRMAPTTAGIMLGSLKYLADYPYGCVEQTMSKFLPTVIAADTLKSLGRQDKELEKVLPSMVEVGLKSIYDFQRPDGGWGWWEDESSPYTTAYVVYGLTHARNAGYEVDADVLRKGIQSLKTQLARVYTATKVKTPDQAPFADPTQRVYMMYALALNGESDANQLIDVYNKRKEMGIYGKAILALTLYETGARETAVRITDEIVGESKVFKGMRSWKAEDGWDWDNSSIEASAYALRAIIRRNPKDPMAEEVVRWLTLKRSGYRWESTKDTAAVIYALAEYIKAGVDVKNLSYTVDISVNGNALKPFRITPDSIYEKEVVIHISGEYVKTGDNIIIVKKSGSGPLYYSTVLKYFSLEENIKQHISGIRVKREYFRLVPKTDSDGSKTLSPKPIGKQVKIGERILCRLTLDSDNEYHYVIIEDPRPAGWESIEQLSDEGGYGIESGEPEGWTPWTRREFRDEKVAIFATRLPQGKWTAEYYMRAEVP
ncbi:MAG: MG2 domain-containing protein, partial [Armatimonadota bacterium]